MKAFTKISAKDRHRKENFQGYLFITPLFLFFVIFTALPVIITLFYLGFTKYNIMNSPQWVGLENFKRLLQDSAIPQIAWNVIRLPLFLVPAHVCCSLLLAYGVYRIGNKYLKYICRTAIYFPAIATTASVSIAWGYLFNKDLGVFNWALKELGIITEGIPWLTSSKYAMISIVIFSIWKFSGLHFLYYLIGFENIPVTYYEAARIDGAGEWTLFRKIVLPLLTPSIFYVLLTTMIGTMQAFDEPYFLTHGGPGDNTRTVAMFIYEKAFQSYDMGYASSVAALLLYDKLYEQVQKSIDDTEQVELYKKMETILADDAANVYIQDMASEVVLRKNFGGYVFYPLYVLDMAKIYQTK